MIKHANHNPDPRFTMRLLSAPLWAFPWGTAAPNGIAGAHGVAGGGSPRDRRRNSLGPPQPMRAQQPMGPP